MTINRTTQPEGERMSVFVEPATAQTLLDWGVLHFTAEGWTIDLGIWRTRKTSRGDKA